MVISNTMHDHQSPTKGRETIMAHHRSGAALIMAIVILAALLMLGLPFLFSQSASLTGTRSFAHSQMAQTGRSTAEDLGIGAAYYIVNRNLPPGSTGESTDINNIPGGIISQADPRRFTLDMSPPPVGHDFNPAIPRNTALIGVSLEDESGKLDPNHMDTKAWMRLFEKVGIADWDDGDDGPARRLDDDTDEGQLAYALAAVRFDRSICREGRITRFEQLLEAKPQPDGVRHPLTRSELRQLIPFLTLGSVGQGREGMIDLGTMIRYTAPGSATQERLDSLRPAELVGFPVARELIGAGSVLVSEPSGGMSAQQRSIFGKYHYGMSTSIDLETVRNGASTNPPYPPDSHRPLHGEAVGIEVQAPVNINETSEPVRWVFKDVARNTGLANQLSDMRQLKVKETDAFNRVITGFTLQNPLGVYSVLGTSKVLETQPRDANNGLSGSPAVANGTLTDSATEIHISGGNISAMPHSGYARIESASSSASGTAATNGNQSIVEYISYNNGNALLGGTSTLYNVSRGLAFPGSTGAQVHETKLSNATISYIAPRELPPLGLTSQGIVTIESGSSVADAAGRQGAQQFRRVVTQAVPQEQLLEMRWEKQSHYHALLVQRHGSLMNAFPNAYQRQYDVEPDNQGQTNASNHDMSTGVRPATLRTLLTSTHLGTNWRNGHAWSRSFSMEKPGDDPLAVGDMEYAPSGGGYSASNLTPEGLTLRGTPLSYDTFREDNGGVKNGFFTYPLKTSFSPPINGRQFGLWIKPNKPISGDVTLFDFRSPRANAGRPFARMPWLPLEPGGIDNRDKEGDNYYQNRISLTYEDQTKQLVLTIANGAIEHTEDYGPIVPSEFFTTGGAVFPPATLGPYVDPRSLGAETVPGVTPGINPIGAKFPMNLVQHRYQLDKIDGLKAHMWHQIQVAFLGNDPGHMAIIVDGVVGRSVTKLPSMIKLPNTTTMERGDHITLPSLVLITPLTLAASANPNADSASLLMVPFIEIDALAVVNGKVVTGVKAVETLLPKRGIVRINNEYISYDDLDLKSKTPKLLSCLRARRQDSIVGHPILQDLYPQLEAHAAGSLVVPGGIRLNPAAGAQLYKGGCSLPEEIPNGDPTHNFRVWAELTTPKDVDSNGLPVLLKTEMNIKVQGGVLATQWPSHGYARLDSTGEIIYYENGSKPTTVPAVLRVVPSPNLPSARPQFLTDTLSRDISWPSIPTKNNIPTISLVSFEVSGSPINKYAAPPLPRIPLIDPDKSITSPQPALVQIIDPRSGRVEWISYDRYDNTFGPNFFVANNLYYFDPSSRNFDPLTGIECRRGKERTAFAGADIPPQKKDPLPPTFPTGSRVIPVQSTLGGSHLLVTGDTLTIIPKKPGAGKNAKPYQVCVRYAAVDGASTSGARPSAGSSWDTVNHHFALTEALVDNWDIDSFELMSWPAWSGDDLSISSHVSGNFHLPPFSMPLADAFSPGSIYIGGDDTSRPFLQATNTQPFDGVIDAVYAGEQAGGTASTNNPTPEDNLIINFFGKPKFTSGEIWFAAGAPTGSVIVEATNPIFAHDLGIVQIGGEVFAYERQHSTPQIKVPSSQVIRLIGRGLFGSMKVDHVGPEPVVILPIGPVTRLVQGLGNGEQEVKLSHYSSKGSQADEINAPAIMLCSPDSKNIKMELIAMPNRQTASWLRGMYNTVAQGSWPGNTSTSGIPTDTLAIGWWPRYPSGIHNQQTWPSSQAERSALLRCRMYGWMGYPIRFHDTWLNGGGLASVELLDDGQGTYSVFASALEEGFDWATAANSSFSLTAGGGYQDASGIFSRFQQKPVNGVEMRIRWEYMLPPADAAQLGQYGAATFLDRVATAGNSAPMIGKVKLRAHAPVKILQVEEAR